MVLAIKITVIIVILLQFSLALNYQNTGYNYEEELLYDTFPDNFMWGTATAAYQVSGFISQNLQTASMKWTIFEACTNSGGAQCASVRICTPTF